MGGEGAGNAGVEADVCCFFLCGILQYVSISHRILGLMAGFSHRFHGIG